MLMNQGEIVSMMIEARDNGSSTLSLLGQELEVLPPEIGQLTSLIELDLGLNELTELPPEIGDLTNLTNLKADKLRVEEPLSLASIIIETISSWFITIWYKLLWHRVCKSFVPPGFTNQAWDSYLAIRYGGTF